MRTVSSLTLRTGQIWWTHSRSKSTPSLSWPRSDKLLLDEGKPYKYIAIDTITQLEVWCEDEAKKMYQATPMGKNFDQDNKGLSVLTLPQGAGYLYLRKAFMKWFFVCPKLADHVIFVGHLKDKYLTKNGKEVKANDLSLSGKLREITCANADAIGTCTW